MVGLCAEGDLIFKNHVYPLIKTPYVIKLLRYSIPSVFKRKELNLAAQPYLCQRCAFTEHVYLH